MGGAFWEKFIKVLVHERGFVYLLWLRLTSVKSPIRPFFGLYITICLLSMVFRFLQTLILVQVFILDMGAVLL